MFCSRAFAFMALVLLKTLSKMHNTQKIYVGNTNEKNLKKNNRKIRQHDRTSIFFWFIFVILLVFLCCQHKFKIIMYLVSKFKFPNISLKNIKRKSLKITKNHHRIREKNTQIWKKAYYISPNHSPPPIENTAFSPFRFVLWPRHKNSKKYDVIKASDSPPSRHRPSSKSETPPPPRWWRNMWTPPWGKMGQFFFCKTWQWNYWNFFIFQCLLC